MLTAALALTSALTCAPADADRLWIDELLAAWNHASRTVLHEEPQALPLIVFFDESCAWRLEPGRPLAGAFHGGRIGLPDSREIAPRLTTFVATYGDRQLPYLVMAMPSVWRAEPRHADQPSLPQLMRAVFTHEMAHARQAAGIGHRLDAVQREYGLPDDLNDDVVQDRFAGVPGFRQAYERERDLLYQAARETDAAARRAVVAASVAAMRARRDTYFTGRDAIFAQLEDIFLGMEGLGQFVAYRTAMRDGMLHDEAVAFMRGGGRSWSQDEGLAAFLVIDALLPGWERRVLGSNLPGVLDLLTEAAGR